MRSSAQRRLTAVGRVAPSGGGRGADGLERSRRRRAGASVSAHRRGDADQRRAAHPQCADRLRDGVHRVERPDSVSSPGSRVWSRIRTAPSGVQAIGCGNGHAAKIVRGRASAPRLAWRATRSDSFPLPRAAPWPTPPCSSTSPTASPRSRSTGPTSSTRSTPPSSPSWTTRPAGSSASGDIRAVLLTGAGTKAFVAGADIGEIGGQGADGRPGARARGPAHDAAPGAVREAGARGGQRLRARRRMRAGHGLPSPHRERRRAVRPARGQARASGRATAARSGSRGWSAGAARSSCCSPARMIDAQEAWRIGLVNRVVPADRLLADSTALLRDDPGERPARRARLPRAGGRRPRDGAGRGTRASRPPGSDCSARRPTCAREPGRFWRSERPSSPGPEPAISPCNRLFFHDSRKGISVGGARRAGGLRRARSADLPDREPG